MDKKKFKRHMPKSLNITTATIEQFPRYMFAVMDVNGFVYITGKEADRIANETTSRSGDYAHMVVLQVVGEIVGKDLKELSNDFIKRVYAEEKKAKKGINHD